ncbi:MAG: PilZ domain-containing protein [Candidatus Omnitrophota bacterium]|nr:PilZ domain-containing protein [Candidatus Omnitrophota bacterium]
MTKEDRRSFPRINDDALTLKLNLGDYDTMTHTLNISASGIYCKVDREVPIMSRVKLMLMLPDPSKNDKDVKSVIEVEGVVVRGHPVIIDGVTKHHDVAIFFENLSQKNREAISNYIAKKG